jgi:class 3 adenylate cyclase
MTKLPSGTVTFLFSDIEGSTRLLRRLGENYEKVLTDHGRLLREAFERARGRVVDTQGDAFFAVFRRAQDAVAAAVDAQRALAGHEWPVGTELRVRMAIHTGEPSRVEGTFVGLSIHRTARICAAGHGGQVLLSSTTRDLIEDRLPAGVALVELGEHHLKDLDRPERIAQLLIEGLPAVLTPLKSLDSQPVKATPFAGQEGQLALATQAAFRRAYGKRLLRSTRWRVALLSSQFAWRDFLFRRRSHTMEGIGVRLYAFARFAPGETMRAQVASLGGAVVMAARSAADAERLLGATDRKALARRLARYRVGPASENYVQAADAAARQIAALDVLVERRQAFEEAGEFFIPRLKALPDQIFQARVDEEIALGLEREVTELRERVHALGATLQDACRRVITEQARQ